MDQTEIIPTALVTAVKDHVFCELDGETVILHTDKGKYYGLNEVGTAVWSYIQEPRTLQEIVDMVHGKYEGEIDQMSHDIQQLLQGMLAASLVQVQDGNDS